MLPAIAFLLIAQLIGEGIVRALEIPFPGPVVGAVLLCIFLVARVPRPTQLDETADAMLKHLSLLFVPAGVGVVQHLERVGADGVLLIIVVVLTTIITLVVTALVFEFAALALQVHHTDPREPE
jgi:holin-like protein